MASVLVIKLGGETLEEPSLTEACRGLAEIAAGGDRIAIVHGAGPQTTAASKARGITPRVVGGRRITDEATLAVLLAVTSELSARLIAALDRQGVAARVLEGAVLATRRPPRVVSGAGSDAIDFGHVGDITGFDLTSVRDTMAAARVAVLPCVGRDPGGRALNINADIVASQLASALSAQALLAVAGVGGVRRDKDDPSTRLSRLTVAEAKIAIADGTVKGGMIPKLEEAFVPLATGVAAVHIVGPSEIGAAIRRPGSVGTTLVP